MPPAPPRPLPQLAAHIDAQPGWWRFPSEPAVQGFLGDGDVFFVGDQPSTSPWPESDRGRRIFYDGLVTAGLGNAHLTDLIKVRGRASASAESLPADFQVHLAFFREEFALLRPRRVVAVGRLCEQLLRAHVPEAARILGYVEHFAYAARPPGLADYPARLARAAGVTAPRGLASVADSRPRPPVAAEGTESGVAGLVTRVHAGIRGVRPITWTLRRDNNAHHHGVVSLSDAPVFLDLSWRPSKDDPETPVGLFRLDLRRLLQGGFIRHEPDGVASGRARVRVVMRTDDTFALQVRTGAPSYPLPLP